MAAITTLEIAAACEVIARDCLVRDGVEVAENAVNVLRHMPGLRTSPADQVFLECLAWLHVASASAELSARSVGVGIPEHLLLGVRLLHRTAWMTDHWYARQVAGAPGLVKIVFVAVELARLLASAGTDERRRRLIATRTEHWVIPIAEDLGAPWGPWFVGRLRTALA